MGAMHNASATGRQESLWTHHDFLKMWASQFVSSFGTSMADFVLPLLVLTLTGSPAQAGAVAAVEKLPYVLLAIPAGAILDRIDRRRVMVASNAVRSIILAGVALYLGFQATSLWILVTAIVLSGLCFVFFDVADNAAFPRLVPKSRLAQASGWMEGSVAVSQLAGPAVAGLILGISTTVTLGASFVYGADALALVGSAAAVLSIRTSLAPPPAVSKRPSLLRSAREGVVYVSRHPELRRLALANFVNCLLLATVTLCFITTARQEFAASGGLTGLALAIGATGGVVGSLLTGTLARRFSARRIMLIAGLSWGVGEAVFSLSPSITFLIFGFVMVSLVRPIYFSILYAYRNLIIYDSIRGRANSMYRLLAQAAEPIGLLLAGAALQTLGPRPFAAIVAALFLVNALVANTTPVTKPVPVDRLTESIG